MKKLNLTPTIDRPDDLYECLVAMVAGLDEAQSLKILWRLILLLANQIGDISLLKEAIAIAGDNGCACSTQDGPLR